MKITSMLLLILIASGAMASEVDEYINEGIKLHDEGSYDKAAQQYKKALELEPNNLPALYELAFSYMVSKKNEECIEAAKKGLSFESSLQKKFTVALGSCYSQLGKTAEAIQSFEEGLNIDPTDSHLHLNIAVTFSNIRQDKKAIAHLKEAIKYSNGYSSPYYFIAEIYRSENYRIPALYFYMQFVLLEPNTRRSQDAAKKIYALLYQGLKQKENGGMDIVVNPNSPKDEGDYTAIELALSVAAAASIAEKSKDSKVDLARHTEALTSFIQICSEIEDKNLEATFTWQYAAKNMIALQNSGNFKTYSYILAARAGIQGAASWLDENQEKIKKMSNAIQSL